MRERKFFMKPLVSPTARLESHAAAPPVGKKAVPPGQSAWVKGDILNVSGLSFCVPKTLKQIKRLPVLPLKSGAPVKSTAGRDDVPGVASASSGVHPSKYL